MEPSEAKRLKALEDENGKLKRLLAEAMLDNTALKRDFGYTPALTSREAFEVYLDSHPGVARR